VQATAGSQSCTTSCASRSASASTRGEEDFIALGIVFLMMGAKTALAQTQTCGIINGGDAGGTGV